MAVTLSHVLTELDSSAGPARFFGMEDLAAFETASHQCNEAARSPVLMRSYELTDRFQKRQKEAYHINEMIDWLFNSGVRQHQNLTSFVVRTGCNNNTDPPSLTDESLILVAQCCPNLTRLDVEECRALTDDSIIYLVENCPSITSINVSGCWNLTDRSMMAISVNCPNLVFLNPGRSRHVTWEFCAHGFSFPKLTEFSVDLNRYPFTEAMTLCVARACPNLTKLSIKSASGFTDFCMAIIGLECPNLVSLCVMNNPDLTMRCMDLPLRFWPKLTRLDVSFCPYITKEQTKVVLSARPKIRVMYSYHQ
jgi:hypothetical protein